MNAKLRAQLAGRRAVVAGVIALLTALFFGGMVGFAAAGEPSTEMPERFGVPAMHAGDRGSYNATLVERREGELVELTREREAARFEWLAPRDMLDGQGEPRRVNELRHSMLGFYMSSESGFVSLQDQNLSNFDPGAVMSFDSLTGKLIATGSRSEGTAGELYMSFLADDATTTQLPLCGLIHPLQGEEASTKERVRLFSNCNTPASSGLTAHFKAAATETIAGRDCVVYARTSWFGWATGDDEEMYVWLCADVPYPVRLAFEDPYANERFIVYRLAAWTRGGGTLADTGPSPTLRPAPEVRYAPRTAVMFDDDGAAHPYSLSQAWARVKNDPSSATVRDFLAKRPLAYIAQAHYQENLRGDVVERYWWMIVGDEAEHLSVGLVQTATDRGVTYRYENQTEVAKTRFAHERLLPPAKLPSELPTVHSMMAVWSAYRRADVPSSGLGWSFAVSATNPWCQDPARAVDCEARIWVQVGRRISQGEGFPVDMDGAAHEYSLLTLWPQTDDATVTIAGFSESAPLAQWARPRTLPSQSAFGLALDIGTWRFPAGGYAVGAGFLAIVVGFVYWSWPAIKSAVGVGLFSRVDRPSALEHPARAQLAALVDANPGIHFQEIRRRLGWSAGLARHHLGKLVELGLLTERATSGYTCYYTHGTLDRRLIKAIPALKADGARRILAFAIQNPGAASIDIARGTGLDPATVHYHVRRLVDVGLLEIKQDGREVRTTAAAFAPSALDIAS